MHQSRVLERKHSLFFWYTHSEVLCLIFTKYILAEFVFMIDHRIDYLEQYLPIVFPLHLQMNQS